MKNVEIAMTPPDRNAMAFPAARLRLRRMPKVMRGSEAVASRATNATNAAIAMASDHVTPLSPQPWSEATVKP